MKYWEYTKEQLSAMSTKRLLSFMRSVRKQVPASYGPEECMGCPMTIPCPCQVEEVEARKRHDSTMDLLRSILSGREHVVRK